ncbi:MAG: Phosphotriesterase homology protein [Gemmatimonadaceae bacterium]|nr:Phosphotriesterase homology protein [Gemmatimonadaceae bacterium]
MSRRNPGWALGAVLALGASTTALSAQAPAIPNLAGKVLTVLGPIEPAALGPTLMHEHIFIDFKAPPPMAPPPTGIFVLKTQQPALAGERGSGGLTDFDTQLAEIREFKKAGGGTIVDVTNFGLTRDPEALYRVSEASDLHVVMGAGWYMKTLHPPDMNERTVEELTDILVRDITVGAQGTNIRSGIIGEVGTGNFGDKGPLTENELKSVRASARASRLTGAPILIHSFAPPDELQRALDLIEAEGVDLNHVVMGHTGTGDVAAMKRYTDRGAYIEFDFMGQAPGAMGSSGTLEQSAERIATNIEALIDAGLTERILIAHDVCITAQLKKNGGGGFAYISTMVVPALRAKGVSDATIRTIMVENPRRVLTFVAPQSLVTRQ